jgi:hypothetical protein
MAREDDETMVDENVVAEALMEAENSLELFLDVPFVDGDDRTLEVLHTFDTLLDALGATVDDRMVRKTSDMEDGLMCMFHTQAGARRAHEGPLGRGRKGGFGAIRLLLQLFLLLNGPVRCPPRVER